MDMANIFSLKWKKDVLAAAVVTSSGGYSKDSLLELSASPSLAGEDDRLKNKERYNRQGPKTHCLLFSNKLN